MAVVHYSTTGAVDTVLALGAEVPRDDRGLSVLDVDRQPDGKILLTGTSVMARYRYDSVRGTFGGYSAAIPGRIEAENYDFGGQGVGYYDTTAGNEQGFSVYRADDVDVKESGEGGRAVGWIAAGEWLAYTVDIETSGSHRIDVRVGSALPGRTFHVEVDGGAVTESVAVPQVADWDRYETVSVAGVPLQAGRHVLRMVMGPEDFMDLQWFAVGLESNGPTHPIAGRIEAEDYDLGGQGAGYFDTTPGNEQGFPVYRADDVDVKESGEGGHAVGWIAAGEWLAYTVDIEATGSHRIDVRVGSALPGPHVSRRGGRRGRHRPCRRAAGRGLGSIRDHEPWWRARCRPGATWCAS